MERSDNPLRRLARRLSDLAWAFQYAGLFVLALLWWWMMPKGFPILHSRFWMNSVLPPAAMLFVGWVLLQLLKGRRDVWLRSHLGVLGCVLGSAYVGFLCFPLSMMGLRLGILVSVAVAGATGLTLLSWLTVENRPRRNAGTMAVIAVGVLVGGFVPFSQKASIPGTRPDTSPDGFLVRSTSSKIPLLPDRFSFQMGDGTVVARHGSGFLSVNPILRFQSTSPDGFWTLLAPPVEFDWRKVRVVPGMAGRKDHFFYHGKIASSDLNIVPWTNRTEVALNCQTVLPVPVYSHLNSFTELFFSGSDRLFVSFSPCPGKIEILPSDYPAGRPARFAAMMPEGILKVVEASSGEKGPFKVLTEGVIARDAPVALTLWSGETPVYRVTFHDWAALASNQLSPTAGWGMPENAIEFSLADGARAAMIYLTLAGTSVGRGWDSVGHAPGVYRNRVTIELLQAGE